MSISFRCTTNSCILQLTQSKPVDDDCRAYAEQTTICEPEEGRCFPKVCNVFHIYREYLRDNKEHRNNAEAIYTRETQTVPGEVRD